MKDGNETSKLYNLIKERENDRKSENKPQEKAKVIIDRLDEEDRIRELRRRARIEHNHRQRIKRIQNYQMKLAFVFIGVGMFALMSGYWIGNIMQGDEEVEDYAVMTDGLVSGSLGGDPIIHQDWSLKLVNTWNPLDAGEEIKLSTLLNGLEIDERIVDPLQEMIETAKLEAGLDIIVCSAYRSKERQTELFNERISVELEKGSDYWEAYESVCEGTALPGTSEHELGLAVDLVGRDYQNLDSKQQETAVAIWLEKNCYRFGFILRYPEGKEDITGIGYESWHYRYVGQAVAEHIMMNGITLEEYLSN